MNNLKKIVKEMPEKPGIYIMKNEDGTVIYVGKAKKLCKRVAQYFSSGRNHGIKTIKLVENIRDIEYIVTDSEEEALILECNFIKRYRPKYNILLKDDKTYPYIKVTTTEEFPRLLYTRLIYKDGNKYFGPFPDAEYISGIINILSKIYKIRKCNYNIEKTLFERPCLDYHIKLCDGPCMKYISKEEYNKRIEDVIYFLEGNHKKVLTILNGKMQKASGEFNFEEAAKYRDDIELINRIKDKQKITDTEFKEQDIIAVVKDKNAERYLVQVFTVREGKLIDRKHHIFEEDDTTKKDILISFLTQHYVDNVNIPSEIIVEYESEEILDIEKLLSNIKKRKVRIFEPKIGKNKRLLILARKNAEISLEQYAKKRYEKEEVVDNVLNELKEIVGLNKPINRIESYDISNIQGVDNVASMVVFTDGVKDPKEYRKFKIKTIEGPNDIGCMMEVIERRFKRISDEKFKKLPDLILIDGGMNQVEATLKVLRELNINVRVCGLVKDDNHRTSMMYIDGDNVEIDVKSDLFYFLTRVQDEVHRSAITYFKTLHNKNMIKSDLDNIDCIGEVRKTNLMKKFKNIENIKKATEEELADVPGMNAQAARKIIEYFAKIERLDN